MLCINKYSVFKLLVRGSHQQHRPKIEENQAGYPEECHASDNPSLVHTNIAEHAISYQYLLSVAGISIKVKRKKQGQTGANSNLNTIS